MKENRELVKSEFKYYLANVARSARRSSNGINLGKTAVDSFLSFIEPEKLFDYNPAKWSHIESLYDVTTPEEIKKIADELFNDKQFIDNDNAKNQGWRSGAISHYICFINARSFFSNIATKKEIVIKTDKECLQQIFYGAPGTGKSHSINVATEGESVVRTTFHPDSDYSTFVGAYKPTTEETPVMIPLGEKVIHAKKADGSLAYEKRIVYQFVHQAFLEAYIKAWKFICEADGEKTKRQYLVIEEINRGNCAQIFGDLFQLLDRNKYGYSEYPINADKDLQRELAAEFKDLSIPNADQLKAMFNGHDVASEIISGEILLLPSNLYIWATMNTSDQSLFPIDSAFKRRWDWKYIPIDTEKEEWAIKAEGKKYDWSDFLSKINGHISDTTSSEDKMLGFYFCKAENGVISAEAFVGKVVFYLWNDVFKDYGFDDAIFDDTDGGKLEFRKFYFTDGSVNEAKVTKFLTNLGVKGFDDVDEMANKDDDN